MSEISVRIQTVKFSLILNTAHKTFESILLFVKLKDQKCVTNTAGNAKRKPPPWIVRIAFVASIKSALMWKRLTIICVQSARERIHYCPSRSLFLLYLMNSYFWWFILHFHNVFLYFFQAIRCEFNSSTHQILNARSMGKIRLFVDVLEYNLHKKKMNVDFMS